jgi:hypothetical protein
MLRVVANGRKKLTPKQLPVSHQLPNRVDLTKAHNSASDLIYLVPMKKSAKNGGE